MKPAQHRPFLLFNRFSFYAILFLVIQQLIVASSTYWIARLGADIASRVPFTDSLCFFSITLMIVFIPAGVAEVFLTLSKWESLKKYVQAFTESFLGKASLRSDQRLKKENSAFLTSESYLVIDEAHRSLFDWLATNLNVFFNIIAISFVLDKFLMVAYAVSFVLVACYLRFIYPVVYCKSVDFQNARLKSQHHLSSGWDNILIGNSYSYNLWKNLYSNGINATKKNAVQSEGFNSISSSIAMILALLPVFAMTGYLFFTNMHNPAVLAILVATLPRQIQILQHTHVVVYASTSWSALKAKLNGLMNSINVSHDQTIFDRIAFEKIQIAISKDQTITPRDFSEVIVALKSKPYGRLTVRGPNGAGKSTLLNLVKEEIGKDAFLLTTHSEVIFNSTHDLSQSTGQKLIRQLEEIRTHVNTPYLLLDEWDANLDSEVKSKMDQLIDELSQHTVVLEVRHHF